MERKIGEIFEFNGEWYQCVKQPEDFIGEVCKICAFQGTENCDINECSDSFRSDKQDVVFKKLEKVGEPFERNGYMYQEYKAHAYPLLMSGSAKIPTDNGFAVIINKEEDMKTVKVSKDDLNFLVNKIRYGILPKYTTYDEITNEISNLFSVDDTKHSNSENIEKNLRPFDIQKAREGKPVCTRDGRKARIICFDAKFPNTGNIVALVEKENGVETTIYYYDDGHCSIGRGYDLMMLPEKKEGWINVYYDRINGITFSKHPYPSKEEAIKNVGTMSNRIDTVKISWEE